VVALLPGCQRGCARDWIEKNGVGEQGVIVPPGAAPLDAVDCPDGLARCAGGVVEVSRLARIPQPCTGPPERCACPWERVADCDRGCAAEGVEVVIPRSLAPVQLCAHTRDAGALTIAPPQPGEAPRRGCDEGQLYRCVGGDVIACHDNAVAARCVHGCFADDAALDDDVPVSREAAFAILCSR
jgi:hypothetical protein